MCFTLSVNACDLHWLSTVGLCSFEHYTECQGLVWVFECLTLSAKGWSVLMCDLHIVPRVGLCSCVSYIECQGLVFVRMWLTLSVKDRHVFMCNLLWVSRLSLRSFVTYVIDKEYFSKAFLFKPRGPPSGLNRKPRKILYLACSMAQAHINTCYWHLT